MSINVTVSGNPVNIKHGKMITVDPQAAKKEFDKRRLIRLGQVRQQSKELAENVRNKVQKEKKKQLSAMEQEGKQKLKNWQNRKLLELQNQYMDALDDIGIGHKEAEDCAVEIDNLEHKKLYNEDLAKNRGRAAQTKLQAKKTLQNEQKTKLNQRKKIVRDVENTRATLVSTMLKRKSPKKPRKSVETKIKRNNTTTDVNISILNNSSSNANELSGSTDSSERLPGITEEINSSEEFCQCTDSSDSTDFCCCSNENVSDNAESEYLYTEEMSKSESKSKKADRAAANTVAALEADRHDTKSFRESIEDHRKLIEDFRSRPKELPAIDTRISDRLRRRHLMAKAPDYCDFVESNLANIREQEVRPSNEPIKPLEITKKCVCYKSHKTCPCGSKKKDKVASTAVQTDATTNIIVACKCTGSEYDKNLKKKLISVSTSKENNNASKITSTTDFEKNKPDEPLSVIPSIPSVNVNISEQKIGSRGSEAISTVDSQKVHFYDHANRFSSTQPSTSHTEKTDANSLEVIPNVDSENEWHDKMKQRDKEAEERGKKALEKEKTRKDYDEMMKKLPLLQRKEHISQIGSNKPEYHMSEERLKQKERERQNKLENAYAQAIPELRPKIVTLPSRKHNFPDASNEPFEIINDDDSRTLDLGKWDTNSKQHKMFSLEEVREIIKAFSGKKPEDRKAKLKKLLKNLKDQKDHLIRQLRELPQDTSIDALLKDLTSVSDEEQKRAKYENKENAGNKKRQMEETDSNNTSSETSSEDKIKSKQSSLHNRKKHDKKRAKTHERYVLILQNMSTQTTPKTEKEPPTSSSARISSENKPVDKNAAPKLCILNHIPCKCTDKKNISSEEVCKILIKLDQNEPTVEVLKANSTETVEKEKKTDRGGKSDKITKPESARETERRENHQSKGKTIIQDNRKNNGQEPRNNRTESWKQQLSQNSASITSYMSPSTDYSKSAIIAADSSKVSMYNLRKKPQQCNFSCAKTKTSTSATNLLQNGEILNYVKRVLSMSKASVDELGVSTSDIQTPSQSIIEIDSNNPLADLHNAVRLINQKTAKIVQENYVTPPTPPNTSEDSLRRSLRTADSNDAQDKSVLQQDNADSVKQSALLQCADMTDSCTQRIANLAAMIEKLREEKLQMLQSPPLQGAFEPVKSVDRELASVSPVPSDKEGSTKYMDLPVPLIEKSKDSNSTVSMDEEEINKRLLEIDMSLAEKLKKFRKEVPEEVPEEIDNEESSADDPVDQQFLDRLKKLTDQDRVNNDEVTAEDDKQTPFVSFLLDIPKLPILEPEPEGDDNIDNTLVNKRHPPPSKGLIAAKKFNDKISIVPHELSTIVEADSQISTKISPNTSKLSTSIPIETATTSGTQNFDVAGPSAAISSVEFPKGPPPTPKEASTTKNSSKSYFCTDETCTNTFSSTSSKLSSSSSGSDIKSIETMLKSIGMEWAIPTVHKTQETLAMSSSSSTGEASGSKKKSTSKRSTSTVSEISLTNFLKKQLMNRVVSSSSMNKSDNSPGSFLKDCTDLSSIRVNKSAEKENRKTSTPVLSSKSASGSKSKEEQTPLFTGSSNISSVRDSSSCSDETCKKLSKTTTFQSLSGHDSNSSVSNTMNLAD